MTDRTPPTDPGPEDRTDEADAGRTDDTDGNAGTDASGDATDASGDDGWDPAPADETRERAGSGAAEPADVGDGARTPPPAPSTVTGADRGDPVATATPDAPIVELRGVGKEYHTGGEVVEALKDVDFAAAPGEFVAVMGPSGSGKSTMLNVLGLLDAPTSGVVLLDGRDVTSLTDAEMTRERKRSIGFVFQHFHLIPTLTALENVELPTLFGRDATARERAVDLLSRVGLGDRLGHRPDQLSGGQKQRVAIARALVNGPRLLLADEPTGNLDRKTGRDILEEFTRIRDEEDVAIVAVTHDPQVTKYADRTVRLVDGRIDSDERRVDRP